MHGIPGLLRGIGGSVRRMANSATRPYPAGTLPRQHNLFDAAAAYVVACIEDDQDAIDAAERRVSPDALMFGVSELAQRAVLTLAREHGTEPREEARTLLGLPGA